MLLRLLAYIGCVWAARRLDRKRFAQKYRARVYRKGVAGDMRWQRVEWEMRR